jgi:hypothetical protein
MKTENSAINIDPLIERRVQYFLYSSGGENLRRGTKEQYPM